MDNNNFESQNLDKNSEQNQLELQINKSEGIKKTDDNNECNNIDKNENIENDNNNINIQNKLDFSINENQEPIEEISLSSSYLKEAKSANIILSFPEKIRPNLIRLSYQIFKDISFFKYILNFLKIIEINNIRRLNHY